MYGIFLYRLVRWLLASSLLRLLSLNALWFIIRHWVTCPCFHFTVESIGTMATFCKISYVHSSLIHFVHIRLAFHTTVLPRFDPRYDTVPTDLCHSTLPFLYFYSSGPGSSITVVVILSCVAYVVSASALSSRSV